MELVAFSATAHLTLRPAIQTRPRDRWDAYAQILVRDNAFVFSVEHVRLLISADKVRRHQQARLVPCAAV